MEAEKMLSGRFIMLCCWDCRVKAIDGDTKAEQDASQLAAICKIKVFICIVSLLWRSFLTIDYELLEWREMNDKVGV